MGWDHQFIYSFLHSKERNDRLKIWVIQGSRRSRVLSTDLKSKIFINKFKILTKEFTIWHIHPIWPITAFNVKFSHLFILNSINFFLLHKQNKTTEPGTDIFILKAKAQNFLCCNLFYLFLKCFPFCLYISKQLILLEKPEAFKKLFQNV